MVQWHFHRQADMFYIRVYIEKPKDAQNSVIGGTRNPFRILFHLIKFFWMHAFMAKERAPFCLHTHQTNNCTF